MFNYDSKPNIALKNMVARCYIQLQVVKFLEYEANTFTLDYVNIQVHNT